MLSPMPGRTRENCAETGGKGAPFHCGKIFYEQVVCSEIVNLPIRCIVSVPSDENQPGELRGMEFHCDNLLLNILIFAAGLWFLIKGSDVFVDSAAAIARIWKVPELVIGLTLVSIGTSLPEFASSLYAAWCGETDFIIGNVIGSNVTNITLILGAGVLGAGTLAFSPQLFSRDAILMLGVFVVTNLMVFCTDVQGREGIPVHGINIWSGILLLLMGIGYCFFLFRSAAENPAENPDSEPGHSSPLKSFLWLGTGLAMIIAGSKALVDTVVWGAEQLAVDTMIISATLVAFGTSVPELAVTLTGVFKKQHDIAIGNIIGSCSFNILLILGVCALVTPLGINSASGVINVAMMLASGIFLITFMSMEKNSLFRWQGVVLLLLYCGFLIYNFKDVISRFL